MRTPSLPSALSSRAPSRSTLRLRTSNPAWPAKPASNADGYATAAVLDALHALDTCGVATMTVALDGTITFLSPKAQEFTGGPRSHAMSAVLSGATRAVIATGLPAELSVTLPGPSPRTLSVRVSSLGDHRGGLLMVLTDSPPVTAGAAVGGRRSAPYDTLTAREREVADHIAAGQSYVEIAAALGVTVHTVRRHTERIFAKFGVQTRARLMAKLPR